MREPRPTRSDLRSFVIWAATLVSPASSISENFAKRDVTQSGSRILAVSIGGMGYEHTRSAIVQSIRDSGKQRSLHHNEGYSQGSPEYLASHRSSTWLFGSVPCGGREGPSWISRPVPTLPAVAISGLYYPLLQACSGVGGVAYIPHCVAVRTEGCRCCDDGCSAGLGWRSRLKRLSWRTCTSLALPVLFVKCFLCECGDAP